MRNKVLRGGSYLRERLFNEIDYLYKLQLGLVENESPENNIMGRVCSITKFSSLVAKVPPHIVLLHGSIVNQIIALEIQEIQEIQEL